MNMDNQEEKVGLEIKNKVRYAFGALNRGATCSKCKKEANSGELTKHIENQEILRC